MAKVRITITDKPSDEPGKDTVDVQIKADPPFDLKDETKNTLAHALAGVCLEALHKAAAE